jgi:hypothetical protein
MSTTRQLRDHRPIYRAGELIPCGGCQHQVSRVSRGTVVRARTLAFEADAKPGSVVHRCRSCRTFTEVLVERASVA